MSVTNNQVTKDNVTPAPWGGPVTIPNRYTWPPLAWWAAAGACTDRVQVLERNAAGDITVTGIEFEPEMLPTLAVKALRTRVLEGHGEIIAIFTGSLDAPFWCVDITCLYDALLLPVQPRRETVDPTYIDLRDLFTEQEIDGAKLWLKHNKGLGF
jgi:hypothetical protein